MAIIDAHAHIYPTKLAAKAVDAIGDFYAISMGEDGTADGLAARLEEAGISHAIVHSVAVKPSNVETINTFIAQECAAHPNFIGFMTMHPDYQNPEAEIQRCLDLGLRGMKIHPDTQMVDADDPRMMRIYEMIEGRMALTLHAGDYRYDFSHPRRIKAICQAFPNLKVDAAHFGGWSVYDLAVEYLEEENCFMDCSSSFAFLGARRSTELIKLYGAERILFGSDFPMWSPASELAFLKSLDLSEDELAAITWHNAENFVGMSIA